MFHLAQAVFASLSAHRVKYVVIGGVAAIAHGVPRTTVDVDILIEATPQNAKRLLDALLEAGLSVAEMITPEALLENEIVVFKDRVRVDVQTSTPGVTFAHAWKHRETRSFAGQKFHMLSLADLIASKRAADRPQDREDVEVLEAIRAKRRKRPR